MLKKKPNKLVLDFTMQTQLQTAWCWSALATSAALFYKSKIKWTQCKLASVSIKPPNLDCCLEPENITCDQPWFLINPENEEQGAFVTTGIPCELIEGVISGKELINAISQGKIVAFRLNIDLGHPLKVAEGVTVNSFAHFVAIAGYEKTKVNPKDEELIVYVYDSFSLEGGFSKMSFQVFKTNYKCHGGFINDPAHNNAADPLKLHKISHSFLTSPISPN